MKNNSYKKTRIDRHCFTCKEIKQQQMLNMHKTYCFDCKSINSIKIKNKAEARKLDAPTKLGQMTTQELFAKACEIYDADSLKEYSRRDLIDLLKKEGY